MVSENGHGKEGQPLHVRQLLLQAADTRAVFHKGIIEVIFVGSQLAPAEGLHPVFVFRLPGNPALVILGLHHIDASLMEQDNIRTGRLPVFTVVPVYDYFLVAAHILKDPHHLVAAFAFPSEGHIIIRAVRQLLSVQLVV